MRTGKITPGIIKTTKRLFKKSIPSSGNATKYMEDVEKL